jgi:hypothetical protein
MVERHCQGVNVTSEEERLLAALAGMCVQYLERRDGFLDHMFMVAGEDAMKVLATYGLVEVAARGGTWTEAGREFLASH